MKPELRFILTVIFCVVVFFTILAALSAHTGQNSDAVAFAMFGSVLFTVAVGIIWGHK